MSHIRRCQQCNKYQSVVMEAENCFVCIVALNVAINNKRYIGGCDSSLLCL